MDWSSDVCSSDLGRFAECFLERGNTGPFGVDRGQQGACWLATALRRQAVPVKRVIPHLGGVIEHAAGRLLDNLFERSRFEFGARNAIVKVVDRKRTRLNSSH